MTVDNAVILAAGRSQHFAPFTYEIPKGLFRVHGEVLVERQIKQLKEAGVNEIYIVVGYMKEKFFYLEEKYGVNIVLNGSFENKGNINSLYSVKDVLKNTYICCADHYFINNPFLEEPVHSYRAVTHKEGKFREFAVKVSDVDVITDFKVGGNDSLCMVGQAFVTEAFSKKLVEHMEREINDFLYHYQSDINQIKLTKELKVPKIKLITFDEEIEYILSENDLNTQKNCLI